MSNSSPLLCIKSVRTALAKYYIYIYIVSTEDDESSTHTKVNKWVDPHIQQIAQPGRLCFRPLVHIKRSTLVLILTNLRVHPLRIDKRTITISVHSPLLLHHYQQVGQTLLDLNKIQSAMEKNYHQVCIPPNKIEIGQNDFMRVAREGG